MWVPGQGLEPLTSIWDKGVATVRGLEPKTSTLDSVAGTGGELEPPTLVLDLKVPTDWGLNSRSQISDKNRAPLGRLEPLTSTGGIAAVATLGLELVTSKCANGGKTDMGLEPPDRK